MVGGYNGGRKEADGKMEEQEGKEMREGNGRRVQWREEGEKK